jgi:hypothetical protein
MNQTAAQASPALAGALTTIANAFPVPCSLAILRSDGTPLAKCHVGLAEFPSRAYAHLALAAQAARRALLVADWGSFEEYHAVASDALLVVRRLARGEHAVLFAAALPRDADPALVGQMLSSNGAQLLDVLSSPV